LIDVYEVLLKFLTVVAVQDALDREGARADVRIALAGKLYTPALGTWHGFLQAALGALDRQPDCFLPELITLHGCQTPKGTPKRKGAKTGIPLIRVAASPAQNTSTVFQAFSRLTELRNFYGHGATPPPERCLQHIKAFGPVLERLYILFGVALREIRLETDPDGEKPILIRGDRQLMLYPLLLYRREQHEACPYFFFNDRKRNRPPNFLEYLSAEHYLADSLSVDDFFLKTGQPSSAVAVPSRGETHLQDYLSDFIGRENELGFLENSLSELRIHGGFLVLWGPPGIGKSAMMFSLFDRCDPVNGEVKENENKENVRLFRGPSSLGISSGARHKWIAYIRRSEGTLNQPQTILKDLVTFLEQEHVVGRNPQFRSEIEPMGLFTAACHYLRTFSEKTESTDRAMTLFFDGLDEGEAGFSRFLPRERHDLGERVVVIVSSREVPGVRKHLPEHDGINILHKDLRGMAPQDIRGMLYQGMSKYHDSLMPKDAIEEKDTPYVQNVLDRSEGNPLYLIFLVDEFRAGRLEAGRIGILPLGLVGVYKKIWDRLRGEAMQMGLKTELDPFSPSALRRRGQPVRPPDAGHAAAQR
jgi:hypothetical protein